MVSLRTGLVCWLTVTYERVISDHFKIFGQRPWKVAICHWSKRSRSKFGQRKNISFWTCKFEMDLIVVYMNLIFKGEIKLNIYIWFPIAYRCNLKSWIEWDCLGSLYTWKVSKLGIFHITEMSYISRSSQNREEDQVFWKTSGKIKCFEEGMLNCV